MKIVASSILIQRGNPKRSLEERGFWRFGNRLEELKGKEGVKKIQWCCRKVMGLGELRA